MSLLPAATEIAWALGAGEEIVGRSHECDFPAGAQAASIVSRPRIDPSRPGAEIHASVKALLERSLSIYEINVGLLRGLAPDVILTQDQCAVCAVPLAEVSKAACAAFERPVKIVSLSPMRLADVRGSFATVAEALGRDAEPMTRAFDDGLARVAALPRPDPLPRVLGLEWLDPPMAAGNWFGELLAIAGGTPAIPAEGRTETVSWEAVDACRADLSIVVPCGFDLARGTEELKRTNRRPPGRVCVVDGNAFVNRPGPRLLRSAEIFASALRGEPDAPPDWKWI